MDDDQQFCLRWNNHQSTLISVFDTLLENETLVDCTLAAEGKFLKAHKVVLSACSPYFASLLSQQYDKHPIFILKDVKFQELRAMMDYMYRGEVNISQDQLAALLKAAESLQIKGLSDSRSTGSNAGIGGSIPKQQQQPTNEHKQMSVPGSVTGKSGMPSGYTLEQKRPRHTLGAMSIDSQELCGSREGSSSPTSRKRKKLRRRSVDNIMADIHEHSNSSSHSMQVNSAAPSNTSAAIGSATTAASSSSTSTTVAGAVAGNVAVGGLNVTKKTDSLNTKLDSGVEQDLDNDGDDGDQNDDNEKSIAQMKKEQSHKRKSQQQQQQQQVDNSDHHHHGKDNSDMLIEPKSEYDDGNDETVEDLTLDEEELLEDLDQAGPSHGGEGSSQGGYAQWQVERSQDEVYIGQDSTGQQRDPQAMMSSSSSSTSLAVAAAAAAAASRDLKFSFQQIMTTGTEALNLNERFPCNVCGKSYLRKRHLQRHIRDECIGIPPRFKCDLCPSRFRRKYHMVRHINSKHGIGGGALTNSNQNYNNSAGDADGAGGGFVSGNGNRNGRSSPEHLNGSGATGGRGIASIKKENFENDMAFDLRDAAKGGPTLSPGELLKQHLKVEDDWKMKLSLQLISDSLLKERLINALPFAYNNN